MGKKRLLSRDRRKGVGKGEEQKMLRLMFDEQDPSPCTMLQAGSQRELDYRTLNSVRFFPSPKDAPRNLGVTLRKAVPQNDGD